MFLYKSEKTCFYVFFICKLMFLTSTQPRTANVGKQNRKPKCG